MTVTRLLGAKTPALARRSHVLHPRAARGVQRALQTGPARSLRGQDEAVGQQAYVAHLPPVYEAFHVVYLDDISCTNLPEVIEIAPTTIEAVPGFCEKVLPYAVVLLSLWTSQGCMDRAADRGDTQGYSHVSESEKIDGTSRCVVRAHRQRALEGG